MLLSFLFEKRATALHTETTGPNAFINHKQSMNYQNNYLMTWMLVIVTCEETFPEDIFACETFPLLI